jgi:hypothetical protein
MLVPDVDYAHLSVLAEEWRPRTLSLVQILHKVRSVPLQLRRHKSEARGCSRGPRLAVDAHFGRSP